VFPLFLHSGRTDLEKYAAFFLGSQLFCTVLTIIENDWVSGTVLLAEKCSKDLHAQQVAMDAA
jgi:hypothetical protein